MTAWPEVGLGEICEFRYGKSLPAADRDGGQYPVFGSNGVVGTHSNALTRGPTIIIGRKGSFGEVAYSDSPCWPIDTTYYVDSTSTDVNLKWLSYRLRCLGLTQLNSAAAIPGLNRETAYRQRLLLPPVADQLRIVAILDRAYDNRTKRHRMLAGVGALSSACFRDLYADGEWPTRPLVEVVRKGTVVTYGIVQAGPDYEGGVPYIRTGDIVDGQIEVPQLRRTDPAIAAKYQRSRVRTGEVVMSIRSEQLSEPRPSYRPV